MAYWGGGAKRAYHHTAPVNSLYALHESLCIVKEEGLQASWTRHQRNHLALRAGHETMGLSLGVNEADRLPQLNLVSIPQGIDEAAVRGQLLNDFDLEIGAGLGELAGKVWRIGLMGYGSNPTNVRLGLSALENALIEQGLAIAGGNAIAAANAIYAASE
jgi:alanine-glyoxylate transaminase/serine-glyoxylate transaminase/serine-pyruvate transaminase